MGQARVGVSRFPVVWRVMGQARVGVSRFPSVVAGYGAGSRRRVAFSRRSGGLRGRSGAGAFVCRPCRRRLEARAQARLASRRVLKEAFDVFRAPIDISLDRFVVESSHFNAVPADVLVSLGVLCRSGGRAMVRPVGLDRQLLVGIEEVELEDSRPDLHRLVDARSRKPAATKRLIQPLLQATPERGRRRPGRLLHQQAPECVLASLNRSESRPRLPLRAERLGTPLPSKPVGGAGRRPQRPCVEEPAQAIRQQSRQRSPIQRAAQESLPT